MTAGQPRLRAQVLIELVDVLRERGDWEAVAAHLPEAWTEPQAEPKEDAWVGMDDYLGLLDAVGKALGTQQARRLGFFDGPRPEDSLVGGKIQKLQSALVSQPVDWLTLPGWLWRSITRDAGVMRKIELGDSHVVFRLERLPERLVHHPIFHERIMGLLESMARRAEIDCRTEVEIVEGRGEVLQFRLSWSPCPAS